LQIYLKIYYKPREIAFKKEAPSEPKKCAIRFVYKQDAPMELQAIGRLTPAESRVYRTEK
jgi:hypothetical protein